MNLEKLNPWNWFKHEENSVNLQKQIPISRSDLESKKSDHLARNNSVIDSSTDSFLRLHREMDRLFEDVWKSFGRSPAHSAFPALRTTEKRSHSLLNNYSPNIDISGDQEKYDIALEVPGLSESDLSIEISGDMLNITGEKEEKNESKEKQFYRIERYYGSFKRTLSLPQDANTEDVRATLKDGILNLEIPRKKIAVQDSKRISISS